MNYRKTYFPNLQYKAYLNHAAISPLNIEAQKAVSGMADRYAGEGVKAWTRGSAARDRLRVKLAQLTGCNATDIGLVSNTTHGLNLVALEYPWRSGDRLVLFRNEFPGNIIPWLIAAKRFDLKVLWLDLDDLIQETRTFKQAMNEKPRLLAVSWVQYQNGRTLDLAELSALRGRFDLEVCVDAIQGLGPLTLDLSSTPLDYLVCGGHKWLLSLEGTGFIYVHPERIGSMIPMVAGWLSLEDPVSFLFDGSGCVDYEKPIRADAERFEPATMNQIGFAAMEASIGIFLKEDPKVVSERCLALAARCREGLRAMGIEPADGGHGAGIVSFPMDAASLKETVSALDKVGISTATPDGHLRAAPHFYNTEEEIDYYLKTLKNILAGS
ncbi:MAG: aminotransferase class V-fold PLP-dependent enzyme [Acidobacteriota bacterium]|nr:aminotransferase class V-fold PLP-dependent enzyme [Acidobacteriota bacterium]